MTSEGVLCLDKDGDEVLILGTHVICALGQRSNRSIVDELLDSDPYVIIKFDKCKEIRVLYKLQEI